jgi:hypothetical protein
VQIKIRETVNDVQAFIADESMTLLRRGEGSAIQPINSEASLLLEGPTDEKKKAKNKEKWEAALDI